MLKDLKMGRTVGKRICGFGDRKLKKHSPNIKQEV